MRELNVVRTFWHGSALSPWEEMSLLSFLAAGHEVEIYAYDDLVVPLGVSLCDAGQILPRSSVFAYREGWAKGSFAACSNRFRYALLHQKGGIWTDADVLCLRPLDDLPDATIGWENHDAVNGAVMKFSAGHPAMAELFERASALADDIVLGQAGPWLLTTIVQERCFPLNIVPIRAFYPIHWSEAWKLIEPDRAAECDTATAGSYCVHWWNGALRGLGVSRDTLPFENSFLGQHARRLLGSRDIRVAGLEDPSAAAAAHASLLDPIAESCRFDMLELELVLARLDEKCLTFGKNLNIALAGRMDWWRERFSDGAPPAWGEPGSHPPRRPLQR